MHRVFGIVVNLSHAQTILRTCALMGPLQRLKVPSGSKLGRQHRGFRQFQGVSGVPSRYVGANGREGRGFYTAIGDRPEN